MPLGVQPGPGTYQLKLAAFCTQAYLYFGEKELAAVFEGEEVPGVLLSVTESKRGQFDAGAK